LLVIGFNTLLVLLQELNTAIAAILVKIILRISIKVLMNNKYTVMS
jgi:hypothetical protein